MIKECGCAIDKFVSVGTIYQVLYQVQTPSLTGFPSPAVLVVPGCAAWTWVEAEMLLKMYLFFI